jgi:hypothetical protein
MLPKLKKERMKKEQLIAQLEGAKVLSTQVDIDKVIALIQQLESEKPGGLTQKLADKIARSIERTIIDNSDSFIDLEHAEFELNFNNRIELTSAEILVDEMMCYFEACLDEFVTEEDCDDVDATKSEE